jgi:hypothetical protein
VFETVVPVVEVCSYVVVLGGFMRVAHALHHSWRPAVKMCAVSSAYLQACTPRHTMALTRMLRRMTPMLPLPPDLGSIRTNTAWSRHV